MEEEGALRRKISFSKPTKSSPSRIILNKAWRKKVPCKFQIQIVNLIYIGNIWLLLGRQKQFIYLIIKSIPRNSNMFVKFCSFSFCWYQILSFSILTNKATWNMKRPDPNFTLKFGLNLVYNWHLVVVGHKWPKYPKNNNTNSKALTRGCAW